jgi:hypothetical protein
MTTLLIDAIIYSKNNETFEITNSSLMDALPDNLRGHFYYVDILLFFIITCMIDNLPLF